MILADLFSILLRLGELAFAAIVAGLTGKYLHAVKGSSSWEQGRFIYTEVVAGLSIFFSIIWLIPFSSSFIHWPADFVISVMWFVAFGLMVDWLNGTCGYIFDWDNIALSSGTNTCVEWKTDIAFAFLSAIFWLVSALLGVYWVHRHTTRRAVVTDGAHTRRRWYRSRV
ncbi:membrane-associating domain-containing protein [Bombardia bombarda]|uniref:Membrane-associating domain-containing protein n=1 Tax=Bombardia bombarda TaxID=252184 RepID=A0AA40BWF4_9PEZI|nr:membrane-associating domain-containing protein [Bombardia bombarda]